MCLLPLPSSRHSAIAPIPPTLMNHHHLAIKILPMARNPKNLLHRPTITMPKIDAYLRCIADQENIRERSRKELESAKDYAIQSFAKELLDTVDILNMALASVPEEFHTKASAEAVAAGKDDVAVSMADQLSNLYTGVSMTEVELVKTLKRNGVERHDPQGEVFDPKLHQALFQAPVPDKPPGTIFSVQKLGYTIKGRVLRPAQVGVVAEPK
ncbi:GrpE-domain-containing protein [Absidia repens]|uniref:GrpE protein homolog n=1 Tax=Absidia repens TaxID=90262 RepID=A0A1X2IW29_9FUNG|nr:GrpE-domain-containing protein [Absidia repens]